MALTVPGASPSNRSPRPYTPKHLADKILTSRSALEGERKQVTVLFADVKGWMELAEQLDPEEWHKLLDGFFEILNEGVHGCEGTVTSTPATASWPSSVRRSRTRITPSAPVARPCTCATRCGATPTSCGAPTAVRGRDRGGVRDRALCEIASSSGLSAGRPRDGVNLWGVMHGIRVFVPKLVAQNEGYVVNTASLAGLTSPAGMGPYNVSKHGVVTLSETLYSELQTAKSAVGVSVLCPAFVNTRIHESDRNRPGELKNAARSMSDAQKKALEERTALVASLLAAGQPPEQIAEKTLAAIREKRFYILTHPEMTPLIEQRHKNITEGRDPTPPFGR